MFSFAFLSSGNTVIHNVVKNKAFCHFEKVKVDEREASVEVDRPAKPITEIRKSFEDIKAPVSTKAAPEEDVIRPNLVKEMRKSFENMPFPDPPSEQELRESCSNSVAGDPPLTPIRSSSFHKANGSRVSLEKSSPQSKSASSITDLANNDEGYSTFPNSPKKPGRPNTYLEKVQQQSSICQLFSKSFSHLQAYIPQMSISNVDLTDTEQNSLDEAFGKMHEKVQSHLQIYFFGFFICYKRCTALATATSLSTALTTLIHITTRSDKVLSMNEIGPKKIETIFFRTPQKFHEILPPITEPILH